MTNQIAYRMEDRLYAGALDESGSYSGSSTLRIEMLEFPVVKITPKGFWILHWTRKRFVRCPARKQYAHLTKMAAAEAFTARKRRHLGILLSQLHRAKTAMALASPDARTTSTFLL